MTIAERRAAGLPVGQQAMQAPTSTLLPPAPATARMDSARTNPFAVTSLVLGIVGGSVLAVIFGHVARAQIKRTLERGAGMALAGLILGYSGIAALAIYIIWILVMLSSIRRY